MTELQQIPGNIYFNNNSKLHQKWFSINSKRFLYGNKLMILQNPEKIIQRFEVYKNFCDINVIFLIFFNGNPSLTFANVYIPLDCRLFIVKDQNSVLIIIEMFKLNWNTPLRFIEHGEWQDTRRLNQTNSPYLLNFFHKRTNLDRLFLKLGIIEEPPLSQVIENNNRLEYDGIYYHTWLVLSHMMNISWKTYFMQNYQSNNINGTWTGHVGAVERSDADLFCSVTFINERKSAIDFLYVISTDRLIAFFKLQSVYSKTNHWPRYIQPFEWKIWLLLFVFLLIFTILVSFSNYQFLDINSFFKSLFSIFGAFCQQAGSIKCSNQCTLKITGFIIYLFFYIIYDCYSARIISYLISFQPKLSFTNADELIAAEGFRVSTTKNAPFKSYLMDHKEKKWKMFISKYLDPEWDNLPYSKEGLINVGIKNRYGFMVFESIGNFYFFKQNYEILPIPLIQQPFFVSYSINKNSSLKRIFNRNVLKLLEVGVIDYIKTLNIGKKRNNFQKSVFKSIKLDVLILPYTVLAFGYLMAGIILIFEIIYLKRFPNWEPHISGEKEPTI